jgi:type VI secretion system protein ImpJ
MTTRAVHWYAGMFLRPQHFQAAQRHALHQASRSEKWDLQYNWGLRSIDIDLNALENYRFVVRTLEARLRDGTLVSVPEDGILAPLDVRNAFESGNRVTIYLGVPGLHTGRSNIVYSDEGAAARFVLENQDIEDENTGTNAQSLQIRRLSFKLLLSSQDTSGFELLPIARLEKSSRAEAAPQLDEKFIPPLLACDAWRPLAEDIVRAVYDRLGKKIETVANQVTSRGITFESHAQGDTLIFAQLRVLNAAFAVLEILAFAQGIHPLTIYTELCRLAGQLAIFGETRRSPPLARYDHDDLATCFFSVKGMIDTIFDVLVEPEYKERPFVGAGMRMQVSLEPAWLDSTWDMFIGVQSLLTADEVLRLLRPGQLDMKIGSSERVDAIFRQGQAGLRFLPCPTPPRILPLLPGQIYLQVSRDAPGGEWQNIHQSLSLAIRVNENMVAGNIQGQRVLMVKTASGTATLTFTLYMVPH